MKRVFICLLTLVLLFNLISCSSNELSDKDIILNALDSDLKFKPEIEKDFTGESGLYLSLGTTELLNYYKSYLDEDSTAGLIENAENFSYAKHIYISTETENKVFDKIMDCYKNFAVLNLKNLELEDMDLKMKLSIGSFSKYDFEKKQKEIKIRENVLTSSILRLLDYFEH